MKISYYGHACFGIEINNKNILIDPFISGNPLASAIDINKIKADLILISHGHSDHVGDAIEIAKRTKAEIVSNFEIIRWFESKGIKKTHSMNIGGNYRTSFGKIKFVKAEHSSTMPDGIYGGCPGGFIIETNECNLYYAGDTALTYDMKLIGDYKTIDFAMLPIGDNYTMGVDNAVIAADFIKCNKIIAMHFDTFPIIKIDKDDAREKFQKVGKELIILNIEESIEFCKSKFENNYKLISVN